MGSPTGRAVTFVFHYSATITDDVLLEAKRKIMRIIAEKCKSESRIDFEFHQMQYSRRDRSFRIAPLKLIRFQ
jgi:hypothetical protein